MKAEIIDTMGSDLTVVNAARVSFDKESDWDVKQGTDADWELVLKEGDEKLINYLARHNHFTPFTHVMITMRETVPIFVARQRFKHMIGFTYNEVSRRYVDDKPEFFVPDIWRKRAENKKQGSSDEEITKNKFVKIAYETWIDDCETFYKQLLDFGVAPEQARMVLPQSMYTSYYTTGSLAAWARAYKLRIDDHSQKEIQDLAKMWHEQISELEEMETSWTALTKS